MASSSSTDSAAAAELPAGTEIAGFRIEQVIGRGRSALVFEATQVGLDRRVALKLFEVSHGLGPRLRTLRWPEHPNVVRMYAAGASERGDYLALQLVPGPTLEELVRAGKLTASAARGLLSDVADALDAAHRAGYAHGAVIASNVLVGRDGRALLSDFGLSDVQADAAADRVAFAALARRCGGRTLHTPLPEAANGIVRVAFPRRRRWPLVLAAIGVLAAASATTLLLTRHSASEPASPAVLAGAIALGSALPASSIHQTDCSGSRPSGASASCTVVQAQLGSRAPVPRRSGVIRRWAVRGARGDLGLEVIRHRRNTFFMVARTPYVTVPDEKVHVYPTNLPVEAGDLVGLEVAPGAAIGVRDNLRGATTQRWFGPLGYDVRRFDHGPGSGFDHEVLLRFEYFPGAKWTPAGILSGTAAEDAPAGRVSGRLVLPNGSALVVVRVADRVSLDLFARGRRLLRLDVVGAEVTGRLAGIEVRRIRFGRPIVRVSWQNANDLVAHDYVAGSRTLTPLS